MRHTLFPSSPSPASRWSLRTRLTARLRIVNSAHAGRAAEACSIVQGRNRATVPVNADGSVPHHDETLGLSKKLKDALSKRAAHERVVFLDIDLPMITGLDQLDAVADFAVPKLRELESTLQIDGKPAPSAYVIVSNIPDHRNESDVSYGFQAFATGFKIPNFGEGAVYHGMHELMRSRERHADILSLRTPPRCAIRFRPHSTAPIRRWRLGRPDTTLEDR